MIIVQHLLISLAPWLIGTAVGCGLGYDAALLARILIARFPAMRRWLALLPWRTVIVTLPLLYIYVPIEIGVGPFTGAVLVGLFVVFYALPFTIVVLLEHWFPPPLIVRLVALARTLGVASITLGALTYLVGGSGLGALFFDGMRQSNRPGMARGFWGLFAIALVVDLVLGIVQMAGYWILRGKSGEHPAEPSVQAG